MLTHDNSSSQMRQGTAPVVRQTLRDRGIEATRNLREALRLPIVMNDTALLGMVLAEVATEEARRNAAFAHEVRRRYDEVISLRSTTAKRAPRTPREELPPLIPLHRIEGAHHRDPLAPPDPQFLIELYGAHQLARALQEYSVDTLKQTAAEIERTHPGTKPTNRGHRDSLIAYIMKHS